MVVSEEQADRKDLAVDLDLGPGVCLQLGSIGALGQEGPSFVK
jgi:hypothetical protein